MEKALAPKRGFVLLWDGAQSLARPLVGRSEDATVSISRTVLDLAARRQRAVAVEDAVEDRVLRQARSVVRNQLRAVAVAPVLIGGEVAGFLHVDRERPQYAADDAALLDCFAAAFALGGHLRAPASAPPGAPPVAAAARPRRAPDAPIGVSAAWRAALRVADASAAAASTVLITGESGTGKEEIASYLHRRSPRAGGPFVAVNCGAIAETLAESELFGHEKGAFTGSTASRTGSIEAADGGTLFLDEVGELPAAIQVKLLRVLQERVFCRVGSTVPRRVDVRFVAATHRDLEADVRGGPLSRGPLLSAGGDSHQDPAAARAARGRRAAGARAARAHRGRAGPAGSSASPTTRWRRCARWRWPGNVRELGNVLERALVLRAPGDDGTDLGRRGGGVARRGARASLSVAAGGTLASKVDALERAEIETALRKARGVKARAAQALGLSRPTLDKKLADLDIDVWRERRGQRIAASSESRKKPRAVEARGH